MARFGEKLKAIRIERHMTQEELARVLGTSKQVISRYETNQRSPKIDIVYGYAERLGVPVDYLADNSLPIPSGIIPLPRMGRAPLLGTIACGEPILAEENLDGAVDLPEHIRADFALRCEGDSMINARIFDGDIVYIRQQDTVDDGQIAAVLIDDAATLKRVRLFPDHIILAAENPTFRPLVFWGEEMSHVRILGLAVAFTSTVR
ncbi:MAG: helix-turn-helix domain-containing protein [Oscillospiraceae bacterium]|nr:helix-turn-helix domain-containing protein [Oscillospiraceae bacterium]